MVRALSLALVLLGASVQAAEKTDLSSYFTPGALPGDYRAWASDGGETRLNELLEVTYGRNIVAYVSRMTRGDIVVLRESGLVPGKWLLDGGVMVEGLEIDFAKPVRVLPLQIVAGKPYRYRGSGLVYYFGERVGKAKLSGSVTFTGIGPVATPYWSVSDAANFVDVAVVTIKIRGGGTIRIEGASAYSVDALLGGVQSVEQSRTFEDGFLVEEEGPTTWWFQHGVFRGVAVP